MLLRDHQFDVARPDGRDGGLALTLHDLDAQPRMRGREPGERLGHEIVSAADSTTAMRTVPADGLERSGEVGPGELHPVEQEGGVVNEHLALRREQHPAPTLLQQWHLRLGLTQTQLLGDRERGVRQRRGHGREGAANAQLAQQPRAAQVERPAPLTDK